MVMNINKNQYMTNNNNRLQKDNISSVAASPMSEKRTPGAKSEQNYRGSQKSNKQGIIQNDSDAAKSGTDEDATTLQD